MAPSVASSGVMWEGNGAHRLPHGSAAAAAEQRSHGAHSATGAGGKAKLAPTKQNPCVPASERDPGSLWGPWGALQGTHLLFLMGEQQQ